MFSWHFVYAHLTANILEDLPQNLANLALILTVTKGKCEEEIMGKNGIKI